MLAAADELFYSEGVHVVGRNASKTEPAKFLVFFVKDKGVPPLVPARAFSSLVSIDQISGSIATVPEIAGHMFFGQNLLGVSNGCVQGGDRTCHERSKALLELRPAQFDGIEIGRVGR